MSRRCTYVNLARGPRALQPAAIGSLVRADNGQESQANDNLTL